MKTKLFTFFLALLCSTAAWASYTSVNGIYYDFDAATLTATVTYQGSSYDIYSDEYSGSVVIPTTVTYGGQTYSVTSIGYYAFYGCSGLTSVIIPNSVTSIGSSAFCGCSGLASVTIPNSVISIGDAVFYGCDALTSVTIPNSVTCIGNYAFYGCSGLTSAVYNDTIFAYMPTSYSGAYSIPDGISIIAGGAFEDCSGLTSVTIPNSVTSIGVQTFYGCSSLTSVTIPNSVTSIGNWAFEGCSGLTSVTIGNSVTSIGRRAFYGCSGLTSVTCLALIPPAINYYTFYNVDKSIPLYVPANSVNAYQTAEYWSEFLNIIGIATAVNEVQAERNFTLQNGVVVFESAQQVSVYTISGTCIFNGIATQVQLPQSGVYLVKTQNGTNKVVI